MNVTCIGLPPSEGNWFSDLNAGFSAIRGAQVVIPEPASDIYTFYKSTEFCRFRVFQSGLPDVLLLPDPVAGDWPSYARLRAYLGFPRKLVSYWHGTTRIDAGLALTLSKERRDNWFAWRNDEAAQFSRRVMTKDDGLLCAVPAAADLLYQDGVKCDRVRAVGFPVRAAALPPLPPRPAGNPPRIAFPHRLARNRGLCSLETVVDSLPMCRVVILRPSADEPSVLTEGLADVIKRIRCNARVDFRICQSKYSYLDALAACDVILSLSISESFGVSIVEGMALGLPPILPRLPAYLELVRGDQRFLFSNTGEIPEKVWMALENRREFGAAARELAERFTPAKFADRVQSALVDLFGEET